MEFIQLLSFYQIVKTGSFSGASKNVARSQSAVSHQIKNLEEDFNVKLFERFGKKVKLTEEGEVLFDVISTFFNDLENLKRVYAEMRNGSYGSLTLTVSRNLMTYWFADVIRSFIDQFPGIKYKLFTRSSSPVMQEMILNGEADFGIGMKDQLISKKLDFLFWRAFDRVVMVDKKHPLCKKKSISLADIAHYPLILTRLGSTKKVLEEVFARDDLSYEIVMEVDSPDIIKKFLKDSTSVSVFSSIAVTEEDKKNLAVINVEHFFGKVEYGIYYSKDKFVSSVMKHFIKFFAPEIADRLPLHTVR
jgi:DNA-binding transcriptional LysR family regulator